MRLQDSPVSTNIPQKRGVGGRTGLPEQPLENYKAGSRVSRSRHANTSSGGPIVSNMTEASHPQHPRDRDFTRESSGPKKPLYDPHMDSVSARSFQKDHAQGFNQVDRRLHPIQDYHSRQGEPPPVNMDNWQPESKSGHDRSIMQHPNCSLNEKSIQTVTLDRDRRPSSGGSPPVDGPPGDSLDTEPEMLLQPETRPISHEQLVIEVKGIYAGLVMVEAKCIDIDERQSAAAQEKDLSKRVQLKNDQWQSLIALHKQVRKQSLSAL